MERSHTRMTCECPQRDRQVRDKKGRLERRVKEYLNLFWILSIPKSTHIGEIQSYFQIFLSKISFQLLQGHDGRASPHRVELNTERKSNQIYSALLAAPTGFVPVLLNSLHVPLGPWAARVTLDRLAEKPSLCSLAILSRISS